MNGEKKPSVVLLVTQCIITAVLLLTVGIVRMIGGELFDEWKNGWNDMMADNGWIEAGVDGLFGETDGEQTEVTP